MKFKTELHCHTSGGSSCSSESERDTVEKYISYGYKTLVITNHFSLSNLAEGKSYGELVDTLYSAVDLAKGAAKGRINIIEGMELRLRSDPNDYLVYGITREFLNSIPEIFSMNIDDLHGILRENGMVIIQAHPMRFGQKLTKPSSVDGFEVFNGHLEHYSHNDMSRMWVNRFADYPMICTSGSDHHDECHYPTAGITTDTEIKTNVQLIEVLKSGEYDLITCDLEKITLVDDKTFF